MSTKTFTSRRYVADTDLSVVESWWAQHEMPVELYDLLPDDGIIIPGVCAAWIYFSYNSHLAIISWMVGNPEIPSREVHEGLVQVIEELKSLAKLHGVKVIKSDVETSGLAKVLKRSGFVKNHNSVTSLWAKV